MHDHDYQAELAASPQGPRLSPGLLQAPEGSPASRIDLLVAAGSGVQEWRDLSLERALELLALEHPGIVWVDVNGLGTPTVVQALGRHFGFHRLSLEDVMQLHQRPKVEPYPEHVFVVVQVPCWENEELDWEQISLFAGPGFLVSFQSSERPFLHDLRRRFQMGKRLQVSGADYALYAALDVLTDACFPVVDTMDGRLEALEDAMDADGRRLLDTAALQHLRRDLTQLRRVLWNHREVTAHFLHSDIAFVEAATEPYFRDVQDHAVRVLERVEQLRESSAVLFELHLAVSGEKLNEVIRLLTVISTIFIPLTFLVGVYGMNFHHMPELKWKYAYPMVLLFMLGLGLGMGLYFRRKGWLGSQTRGGKP